MHFMYMLKRTSLILFVTFLVMFNTVFNSFVSCCDAAEDLFLNNDEKTCCVCCTNKVNETSLTKHWIGKPQTTIDDCNACLCIPYINNADTFCFFTKRTLTPSIPMGSASSSGRQIKHSSSYSLCASHHKRSSSLKSGRQIKQRSS